MFSFGFLIQEMYIDMEKVKWYCIQRATLVCKLDVHEEALMVEVFSFYTVFEHFLIQ